MFFIEMEAGLMKVVLSLVNVCRPLLTIYSDYERVVFKLCYFGVFIYHSLLFIFIIIRQV